MVPKITWFRHTHENRNDLLRFGLMRLHYSGRINYIELPFSEIKRAGFTQPVLDYPDHRHLSFLLIEQGKRKLRCLVDNEDSFALITPLIAEVDVVFCAGYNSDFFARHEFVKPYNWQDEKDIGEYRNLIEGKIKSIGKHFGKIKKFIPIAPNQGQVVHVARWAQKVKNLEYRINRFTGKGNSFADVYRGFELREQYLKSLRANKLEYDIVLNDSLWGWPQHRVNLHNQLRALSVRKFRVHSTLNWAPPVELDGSLHTPLSAESFPMKTSSIHESYEFMLSRSRLAVFACGFHWGWRNIMMFALQTGIPVMTDRLLTEPYFDMNEFKIFQQEDHQWTSVEPVLKSIDEPTWESWKLHNQAVYDKYMAPEVVAGYFLNTLEKE